MPKRDKIPADYSLVIRVQDSTNFDIERTWYEGAYRRKVRLDSVFVAAVERYGAPDTSKAASYTVVLGFAAARAVELALTAAKRSLKGKLYRLKIGVCPMAWGPNETRPATIHVATGILGDRSVPGGTRLIPELVKPLYLLNVAGDGRLNTWSFTLNGVNNVDSGGCWRRVETSPDAVVTVCAIAPPVVEVAA